MAKVDCYTWFLFDKKIRFYKKDSGDFSFTYRNHYSNYFLTFEPETKIFHEHYSFGLSDSGYLDKNWFDNPEWNWKDIG